MRKTKLLTSSIFVVCVGILLVSCDTKKKGNESRPQADGVRGEKPGPVEPFAAFEIVAYAKGEKIILDPRSPYFAELQLACKEMLASAETFIIKKKNTPANLEELKNKEWAVEVTYAKPIKVRITVGGGPAITFPVSIEVSQLLIPLTGELTQVRAHSAKSLEEGTYVWLFLELATTPPHWQAPIGTTKDVQKIKDVLTRFNIRVP